MESKRNQVQDFSCPSCWKYMDCASFFQPPCMTAYAKCCQPGKFTWVLGIQGFHGVSVTWAGSTHVTVLATQSPAFPYPSSPLRSSCGPNLRHTKTDIYHNLHHWHKLHGPTSQVYKETYQAKYSRSSEVISQESVTGKSFLWNVQSLSPPSLLELPFLLRKVIWILTKVSVSRINFYNNRRVGEIGHTQFTLNI